MKFSITIPAYKVRYLYDAIKSVLDQTYKDFELIIVDDCSPENLKDIVDKFKDSRIRYYRNEVNCGARDVVNNWNICLKYCTGDWVICMGDDDMLMPNTLCEYNELIQRFPNVEILHGRVVQIDEANNIIDILPERAEYETYVSFLYQRLTFRSQYIGDFCYKKESLLARGGFYKLPFAWGSDDISAYMASSIFGIANTNKVVFKYRINGLSISKSGYEDEKLECVDKLFDWIEDSINKSIIPYASSMTIEDFETFKKIQNIKEISRENCKYHTLMDSLRGRYFQLFLALIGVRKLNVSKHTILRILKKSMGI